RAGRPWRGGSPMLEQTVPRGLPRAPLDAARSGRVLLPGPGASLHPAERLHPEGIVGTGRLAARTESEMLQGESPGRDLLGRLMGASGQIDKVFQQVAQV